MELTALRKNKVDLADYEYEKDIENRLLLAQFSILELEVLEEILYSPLQISFSKLSSTLEIESTRLVPILEKLKNAHLLNYTGDVISVDKEARKYFEFYLSQFDEDFKPGMEFLQGLLRKVPMSVLLSWYSIPRTSNNIFDSLIEKYLLTPQTFHRYVSDLNFSDPLVQQIMDEIYQSEEFEVSTEDLLDKYGLTPLQLEQILLQLEFHFVCCVSYKKFDEQWIRLVTPFYEWRQYLLTVKRGLPAAIAEEKSIEKSANSPFWFIEKFSLFLETLKKKTITSLSAEENILADKAIKWNLAHSSGSKIQINEHGKEWLSLSLENRALSLFRQPIIDSSHSFSAELQSERAFRDAEKSLSKVLYSGWVYFDEFLKGVTIPLKEAQMISLKKMGKQWKYLLPTHSEQEQAFLRFVILQWLFEMGITSVGTHHGKVCFSVTEFGQTLFGE